MLCLLKILSLYRYRYRYILLSVYLFKPIWCGLFRFTWRVLTGRWLATKEGFSGEWMLDLHNWWNRAANGSGTPGVLRWRIPFIECSPRKKKGKVYLLVCKLIKLTVHNMFFIPTLCAFCVHVCVCVFYCLVLLFTRLLPKFLISSLISLDDDDAACAARWPAVKPVW